MKIAGYIRVSTNKDGQKESPENQKQMILNYLMENNHDLYDFYTDVQTGTNDDRIGLQQLIADAEQKKFDIIIAKELSRLGRNVELLYQLKRLAETKGIRLITLDGIVDTNDPTKLALFGLYAWLYESESQRTSDRIKSVFEVKYKSGKFLGSFAPYGYNIEDGKLIPRTDETVEIVKEIYDKYLGGWGHDKIARSLSKRGIPTPAQVIGKKNAGLYWQGSSIRSILTNPHYIGDLVQGRETTMNVTNKKRKQVDPNDWIIVPNTHEPLISREIFEQVQKIIEQKAARGRGGTKPQKHLFTNVAYCADCGKGMWYRSNQEGYICGNYGKHGRIACTNHSVKEAELSRVILNDFRKMYEQIDHPNFTKNLEEKTKTSEKKIKVQLTSIEKQLEKQLNLKRNSLQKFVQDEISKQDYDDFVSMIEEKIKSLEIEKLKLKKIMAESHQTDNFTAIKNLLNDFLEFNTLTKEMLNRFVDRIEITESKNIKITYKFSEVKGL